jgi:UDP-2,3-diacylglucosamine hydrolase
LRVRREGQDWIFVSDAHFTGRERGEMESFIRFMDLEGQRIDRLFILGDFFEFLFGFKRTLGGRPFPFREYLPVLEHLRKLNHEGVHITYVEGNHDFCLTDFFSEYFGMQVEVVPEGSEESVGGKRAYVAHGDVSNPKQQVHRIFRRLLKNRWSYDFIQWAGPYLVRNVARKLSEISYQKSHESALRHPPPAFRAFAHQKFMEGFDVVILGHSHFPEEAEEWIDGRRCLYFNVGDWALRRSFLRFTPPERFRLERFEEKTE